MRVGDVNEVRTLVWIGVVLAVAMLATLVAAHERHYSKRSLYLLKRRVQALEDLIEEDRLA